MNKVSFAKKVKQVLGQKCPNCGTGAIFKKDRNNFNLVPQMNDNCPDCGFDFHREPGYFLGAMYASYGLSVFEGIVSFLLAYFFLPQLSTFLLALIPALVILLFSVVNYKLGRVIWMYLFPRDKE